MNGLKRPLLFTVFLAQSLTLIALNSSCGDKAKNTNNDQPSRIRLKIKNFGSEAAELRTPINGDYSITPEVFKIGFASVTLANTATNIRTEIYSCRYPQTDCEVDLANPNSVSALEARLASLEVKPGIYDKLDFSCSNGKFGPVGTTVKGRVALPSGEIIYTSDPAANSGSYATSDLSEFGEISVPTFGCTQSIFFSKPLNVGTDSPIAANIIPGGGFATLSLFTSIVGAVEYDPNPENSGLSSCTSLFSRPVLAPGFCVHMPDAFVLFGETTPSIEHYKLAGSRNQSDNLSLDDANVLLTTIQDSAGLTFGVSLFDHVSATSPTKESGDKGIFGLAGHPEFILAADSRLQIRFTGGFFPEFTRAAHSGEIKDYSFGNSNSSSTTITYRAFPFKP